MTNHTDALPKGLDIKSIYPHERHAWARDETCHNKSKTKFVAAFNIYEATMMNEMGSIVWGSINDDKVEVKGRLRNLAVYCWEKPFAHWIDEDCFAVKIDGGKQRYPIIAVHFQKGLQNIDGFDSLETRASHIQKENLAKEWLKREMELLT